MTDSQAKSVAPENIFGRAAKKYRDVSGKTQYEIGEILGGSRNVTVYRYESGRVLPPPDILVTYARMAASDQRTVRLLRDFARAAETMWGIGPFGFVMAMLVERESARDGRTLARIAKRATEILEAQ